MGSERAWIVPNDDDRCMQIRTIQADGVGSAAVIDRPPDGVVDTGWVWVDVVVQGDDDVAPVVELLARIDADALSVRDAVEEYDLPKVDDFGHHLVVVLHGLREDRIATYEVDCFVNDRFLVTVRRTDSAAIDAMWEQVLISRALATGGVDELLARVADVLTRRLMGVLEAFDRTSDALIAKALDADERLLGELLAVRADLNTVRRVVNPQREALDVLRTTTSTLMTKNGQRRFSDVFDVAKRTAEGLDAARSTLAEILDAYRGAEARDATDVTMVLTIYAAIMLPLSVVAGFFGMNFANLPLSSDPRGWIIVTAAMVVIAAISLGIFVALGWIDRPSGRKAGKTLGRGLIEAARAPAQMVGAAYEISSMPLRTVARRALRSHERIDEEG